MAFLSCLLQKWVLTINMDVPEPWLVEPVQVCGGGEGLREGRRG